MTARLLLATVEAAGPTVIQRCLASPTCVATIGTAGVAVLNGMLHGADEAGNGSGSKGPTLGDVNPNVFNGADAGLPADTYGTPPNGASPPPEGKDSEPNKTVRNQGEPNEVTIYEKNGRTVQMNTGHGMGRGHASGDLTKAGLTQAEVEGSILKDVLENASSLPTSPSSIPTRTINVNGISVGYRAFIGSGNRIYISTYFPL